MQPSKVIGSGSGLSNVAIAICALPVVGEAVDLILQKTILNDLLDGGKSESDLEVIRNDVHLLNLISCVRFLATIAIIVACIALFKLSLPVIAVLFAYSAFAALIGIRHLKLPDSKSMETTLDKVESFLTPNHKGR
jgi:hypothetical protein